MIKKYNRYSIRYFLLIILVISTAIVTLFTTYWTYKTIVSEASSLLDGQLVESAHILRRLSNNNVNNSFYQLFDYKDTKYIYVIDDSFSLLHHKHSVPRCFQILNKDRKMLMKSSSAPDFNLLQIKQGFTEKNINNEKWRIFVLIDNESGLIFQVGQPHDLRNNLIKTLALNEIIPLFMLFPILALIIWYTVKFAFAPLKELATEIKTRSENDFNPVSTNKIPKEILPLVDALNCLFNRLEKAFEREKRFTADAAHELRTPIAVIKTQAQVALRAKEQKNLLSTLEKIVTGTDRCAHLIEQLLILNSVKEEPLNNLEKINIVTILQEIIADLLNSALNKDIEIELKAQDEIFIVGNKIYLIILFRNIIDNAIRYSDAGGNILIEAYQNHESVSINIEDNGKGIPEELRNRVFERFYRELGTNVEGSGLGLSIVQKIAELHSAKLSINNSKKLKGACFTVIFSKK